MMDIREKISKKVSSANKRKPPYQTLLKLVKSKKLATLTDIRLYLRDAIAETQRELRRYEVKGGFSREGTGLNRKRVIAAKWLDELKNVKKMLK